MPFPVPALFAVILSAFFCSCVTTNPLGSAESYAQLAHESEQEPNPLIVIPGVMGTRLVDSGSEKIVWGSFGFGSVWHGSASGRHALSIPMHRGDELSVLDDSVNPAGTLDRLSVFGGIGVDAYSRLLRALAVGGYVDEKNLTPGSAEHASCFEFGYDWRKSNAENAAALGDFIEEKSKIVDADYFRRHGKHRAVKFDIVAHSMGGLIARYYLMYGSRQPPVDRGKSAITWAGKKHINRLIQVAVPNNGSALAVQQMQEGIKLSPLLPRFQSSLIGTFPSAYELLPHNSGAAVFDEAGKPVDIYDVRTWEKYSWGLADPDQAAYLEQLLPDEPDPATRRKIALEHITKCLRAAKAFHTAIDCPCSPPEGVEMHSFYGEGADTAKLLRVDSKGILTAIGWESGDDTVTRSSALAWDESRENGQIDWASNHSIHATHVALPVHDEFIHSLLPLLLKLPKPSE